MIPKHPKTKLSYLLGRQVAANLDATVLDIMTTSSPPVAGITMSDPAIASVASATARTYKSSGRVLEFEVDDETPLKTHSSRISLQEGAQTSSRF